MTKTKHEERVLYKKATEFRVISKKITILQGSRTIYPSVGQIKTLALYSA